MKLKKVKINTLKLGGFFVILSGKTPFLAVYSLRWNQSKSGGALGQGSELSIWSHSQNPKSSLKLLPASALALLAEMKCCAFEWFLEDHLHFLKSVPVSPFPSHSTYIITMANWLFWERVWFPTCQIFVVWDVDIQLQAEHFQLQDKAHKGNQGEFSTPVLHPSTKNTIFKDFRQIHHRLPEVKGNEWSHSAAFYLLLRYFIVDGKLTPGKVTQASQERDQEAVNTVHTLLVHYWLSSTHLIVCPLSKRFMMLDNGMVLQNDCVAGTLSLWWHAMTSLK